VRAVSCHDYFSTLEKLRLLRSGFHKISRALPYAGYFFWLLLLVSTKNRPLCQNIPEYVGNSRGPNLGAGRKLLINHIIKSEGAVKQQSVGAKSKSWQADRVAGRDGERTPARRDEQGRRGARPQRRAGGAAAAAGL